MARNALGSNLGAAILLLLQAWFQVPVAILLPPLCLHRSLDVTFFTATRLPFFRTHSSRNGFYLEQEAKGEHPPASRRGVFSFQNCQVEVSVQEKAARPGAGRGWGGAEGKGGVQVNNAEGDRK